MGSEILSPDSRIFMDEYVPGFGEGVSYFIFCHSNFSEPSVS